MSKRKRSFIIALILFLFAASFYPLCLRLIAQIYYHFISEAGLPLSVIVLFTVLTAIVVAPLPVQNRTLRDDFGFSVI